MNTVNWRFCALSNTNTHHWKQWSSTRGCTNYYRLFALCFESTLQCRLSLTIQFPTWVMTRNLHTFCISFASLWRLWWVRGRKYGELHCATTNYGCSLSLRLPCTLFLGKCRAIQAQASSYRRQVKNKLHMTNATTVAETNWMYQQQQQQCGVPVHKVLGTRQLKLILADGMFASP